MGLFETFFGWWAHPDRILSCCTLEGLDILLQAQQTGRGILLVGPHFTTLEILGVAVALQAPIHVTYRKHNHPVLETLYLKNRAKYYRQSIDKDDSRSLIRSLKSGQTVWLAPDQNFSGKSKGFSPFFGIPAATMPVVSKLAKLTHAIIIPVSFKRTSPTGRYHFTFHPPLDHFPSEDARSDTDRINALFESFVREAPEQYLWSHRRFKTRPPNEPPFY
jgi:KDO2-lipid IV(A) lauroyltransferase